MMMFSPAIDDSSRQKLVNLPSLTKIKFPLFFSLPTILFYVNDYVNENWSWIFIQFFLMSQLNENCEAVLN